MAKTANVSEENSLNNKLIWAILYFVITVGLIISSCFLFKKYYYQSIFVSGTSMQPTLNANYSTTGRCDFGIIDTHAKRINEINRFDIVTTYYPWDSKDYSLSEGSFVPGSKPEENASYKIKRVIALPNETFKLTNNELYLKSGSDFIKIEMPFERKLDNVYNNTKEITLKDNEYWVMGDNWKISQDCYDVMQPVYKENIVGVLVAIQGTCKVSKINGVETCIDRQYGKTIYF